MKDLHSISSKFTPLLLVVSLVVLPMSCIEKPPGPEVKQSAFQTDGWQQGSGSAKIYSFPFSVANGESYMDLTVAMSLEEFNSRVFFAYLRLEERSWNLLSNLDQNGQSS